MLYFASYSKADDTKKNGFYQEMSRKFATFDEAKKWLKGKADDAGAAFRYGGVAGWAEDHEMADPLDPRVVYLCESRRSLD